MIANGVQDDQNCLICGNNNPIGLHADFTTNKENGSATTTVTIPSVFQGWQGITHGGMIAALLDETCAQACMALGEAVVTVSIELRYRAPVPTGSAVTVHGRVTEQRGRRITAQGTLHVGETLCAEASAIFHRLSKKQAGEQQ